MSAAPLKHRDGRAQREPQEQGLRTLMSAAPLKLGVLKVDFTGVECLRTLMSAAPLKLYQ